jgi:hypothetical protein
MARLIVAYSNFFENAPEKLTLRGLPYGFHDLERTWKESLDII